MSVQIALAIAISIVAACLLICCLVYRRSKQWKDQSDVQARQAAQGLAQVSQDHHTLRRTAQPYHPGDPEPYGPIARNLHQRLARIYAGYREHCTQVQQIAAQRPPTPSSLLRQLWAVVTSELPYWRQRQDKAGALVESVRALENQLTQARQLLEKLRTLPLEAARRAQDLHGTIAETTSLMQALQQAGVHGTTFEQAAARLAEIQSSLTQLPGWCALDSSDRVLEQATKAETIRAWQMLDDLEGGAGKQQTTFQRWQAIQQEIGEGLQALQHALGQARMHAIRVPDSIEVEDRALQLNRLEALPAEMQARYPSPTVQDLEALHHQIPPAIEATRELGTFFESVLRKFERLRQALEDLARLARETQVEMETLAQAAEYPIEWEAHKSTPVRLHHHQKSIGALADRRTPESLDEHVMLADRLAQQGQALKQEIDRARNTRTALLHLLARPELNAQPSWLDTARYLHAQTIKHGADNWPEDLGALYLLSDGQALEHRRQQCVPAMTHTRLPVSQLDGLLQDLQTLGDDLAAFQHRLDRTGERLTRLQTTRQAALQELHLTHQAVEQLLALLKNTTPAIRRRTPLYRHQRQLERTFQDGRRQLDALEHPDATRIEVTLAHKDRWMNTCERTLQGLRAALHADRKDQELKLETVVSELKHVAPFDREKAMQEAIGQLETKHPEPPAVSRRNDDVTASQIAALIDDTARTLQDRERLCGALTALDAQIRTRLREQLEATDQARQTARAEYEALIELKEKSEGTWPPLQCDTELAEGHLASAERDEQALLTLGKTVPDVNHYLERIAQEYASLTKEVQSEIGQNNWQRQDVQERWDKLVRWQQALENYSRAHRDEPNLARAASQWRNLTAGEMDRTQRTYRRRPMPHEQARRVLDDLWDREHARSIPVRGQSAPLQARDIESRSFI